MHHNRNNFENRVCFRRQQREKLFRATHRFVWRMIPSGERKKMVNIPSFISYRLEIVSAYRWFGPTTVTLMLAAETKPGTAIASTARISGHESRHRWADAISTWTTLTPSEKPGARHSRAGRVGNGSVCLTGAQTFHTQWTDMYRTMIVALRATNLVFRKRTP